MKRGSDNVPVKCLPRLSCEELRQKRSAYNKEYRRKNIEKILLREEQYRRQNRDLVIARHQKWLQGHREAARTAAKRWKDNNQDRTKELSRKSASSWKKNNKTKARAHEAAREAAKRNATPVWIDRVKVKAIYDLAAEQTISSGILNHVDHIVPLNSKFVCGLHWEQNLQILPFRENIGKGNRRWPDMP